jgi:predicted aspartyl protease
MRARLNAAWQANGALVGRSPAVAADRAHVASSVPLVVAKAKDGEVAALAKVVVHGRAFPFLIDTGAAKRW